MSHLEKEKQFSYKAAFAAFFSMLFVYWMIKFKSGLLSLENNLLEQPYLIRLLIEQLFPDETQLLIVGFDKLLLFSKFFLITFLIKSIISLVQAIKSKLVNSQTYIIILFLIEGLFLYSTFNITIGEIIAILLIPNLIIILLLDY